MSLTNTYRYNGVIAPVIATVMCFMGWSGTPIANATDKTVAAGDKLAPTFRMDLDQDHIGTIVYFPREGPAPWQYGNCVSYGDLTLVNMTFENLAAFRKDSEVRFLTVRRISKSRVLVVDDRVSEKWLRSSPCGRCASLQQQIEWVTRYSEHFRTLPTSMTLAGSAWDLIEAQGVGAEARLAIVEAILPGHRLQFREAKVLCMSAAGNAMAQRTWLVEEHKDGAWINIYDLDDTTGEYEGISFQIQKLGEELHLIPTSKIEADGRGVRGRALYGSSKQPQLYRRRPPSQQSPARSQKAIVRFLRE